MTPDPEADFTTPIDECDVVDKEALRQLRPKLERWRRELHGDDVHSIWRQIYNLLWDAALFRTVNDLRREAVARPVEGIGFNGSVMKLLDVGFVTTQLTAIRRLTDSQPRYESRRVISLRAIVDEVRTARPLLTREQFVARAGLPYDWEAAFHRWSATQQAGDQVVVSGAGPMSGPDAWLPADLAHRAFDVLADQQGRPRSRGDLISQVCLDRLSELLDRCNDLRKYTDKFVAHGADPANREDLTDGQRGVTLERLAMCQKAIVQVAEFLSEHLFGLAHVAPLPQPQYDHLQGLEKAWVGREGRREVLRFWKRNADAICEWGSERIWPPVEPG